MKKLLLVGAFVFIAQFGFGQLALSSHNFTAAGWNTGEICLPCHIPHNAIASAIAPLWNHATSTQVFTPYTGVTGTMDAVTGVPTGISLLCLSCHDGVTALDAFSGNAGTTPMGAVNGNFGTDLSNDHPISFTYNTALATLDGELFDPSVALSGITGSGTIATDMLFAGQMECASCHDVHNAGNNGFMLHKSNAGSALCITCHNK